MSLDLFFQAETLFWNDPMPKNVKKMPKFAIFDFDLESQFGGSGSEGGSGS